MDSLYDCLLDNIFDELDDAEKYCNLADLAKREGKSDICKKAMDTAKQELEHFDWQYNELVATIDKIEKDGSSISKVYDRQMKKYMKIKTMLALMKP